MARFAECGYIAERELATVLALMQQLGRPLLVEGEAGVGKTEIARTLASVENRRLIRLQCYEGLDTSAAVYEWNYSRQLLSIKLQESDGSRHRDEQGKPSHRDDSVPLPWMSTGCLDRITPVRAGERILVPPS